MRVVEARDSSLCPRVRWAYGGLRGSPAVRELFEDQGIRVVGEAADGEDAVRLARHVLPDVVVMDLGLPRPSDVEATPAVHCSAAPATAQLDGFSGRAS